MGPQIAVIGGSAAGFMTAGLLARAGKQVRIYERNPSLAPAARTLIVTDRLTALLGDAASESVVNEINRFELFADGRVATIELDRPDLIVERSSVIRKLAEDALEAGAEIDFGKRFSRFGEPSDALQLDFVKPDGAHDVIETDVAIGADGTNSRVARMAGWPEQPTVPLVQAIVDLPPDVPSDTSRVWFRPEDTPYFYWLVPESDDQGALGVIGEDGPETRRRLDAFLDEQGLVPRSYQAAVIPAYERWIPVHNKRGGGDVYLVGDAAGQVKVSTVGGLVTGLRGAVAVAEAILEDAKPKGLGRLKRELNVHMLIRRALNDFTQDDYIYVLDCLNEPARRSLGAFDRDDASRLLRSLLVRRPQLLLRGVRSLITSSALRR